MELEKIHLYRMIHIENIPHVLEWGITHKDSPHANSTFVPIGDSSLIDTRSTKEVIVDNGDSSKFKPHSIILGDYIPFYFGVRMPMLYVMQIGGNFVPKATSAKEVIYLVCPIKQVINSKMKYYFSDGHATDNFTTFYDDKRIDDLPKIIDWSAVKAQYWGGNENLNIKRKKQAEFLLVNDLLPEYIIGLICYNSEAKDRLVSFGVPERKIKVYPSAYY